MDLGKIRSEIAKLGVPAEQTQLYLHLVVRGPRSAGQAADELGRPPGTVRARLEAMAEKGFVLVEGTDPPTYTAEDPNAFFDAVLSRWRGGAEETVTVKEDLLEELEAISWDRDPGS